MQDVKDLLKSGVANAAKDNPIEYLENVMKIVVSPRNHFGGDKSTSSYLFGILSIWDLQDCSGFEQNTTNMLNRLFSANKNLGLVDPPLISCWKSIG